MISKTVEINSGKNIIDISFDGLVLCLRISKTIIADFYDDRYLGTMGRYFVLNSDYERDKYIKNLNNVLIDGTDEIILEKIIGFLNLFNSGIYCVYTRESNVDYYKIHYDYYNVEDTFYHYDYTVDFRNLMFTQPSKSISRERVDFYKELIKSGYKPRVLTVGHNNLGFVNSHINTEFILDGHHKLLAYSELGVPCNFVHIEKESEEDKIYKKNLFNSYSYFLTEELKAEIIGNNPKMYIENSEESVKYNIEFDNYLRTFQKYISGDVYKLIFKSINSLNNEEKKWGLSKLRIIEKKDFSKEKLILWNIINEHLSLSYREIKSKEEFNYFVLETFGRSLDDIEKNIT